MKKRIYLETSVISYYSARPNRDIIIAAHQEATREFWPELTTNYEAFISALVYDEAGRGDATQAAMRLDAIKKFQMLDIDDEAKAIAAKIVEKKGVPAQYPEDALHIAVATVNGIEVLVTWNFTHLNNPFTRRAIRRIVEAEGYVCPEICSPEELLEVTK